MTTKPTHDELRQLVHSAMRRGVPRADAEDLVVDAWEKASQSYEPSRGRFAALLQRIVLRDAVSWWRRARRREPLPSMVVAPLSTAAHKARAEANQRRLLEALDVEERAVFTAWALQRHLPRGHYDAEAAARAAGLTVREYDNAKRRLKAKVHALTSEWGLAPRDFYTVDDHEGPRR
ncbi:MAG: hypothetical protein EP330_08285 [Deltaproteobacteria bacterium]|nr:MAG: hypothetical protein EP330_08285 [Deltaproteobacteria bacterium]